VKIVYISNNYLPFTGGCGDSHPAAGGNVIRSTSGYGWRRQVLQFFNLKTLAGIGIQLIGGETRGSKKGWLRASLLSGSNADRTSQNGSIALSGNTSTSTPLLSPDKWTDTTILPLGHRRKHEGSHSGCRYMPNQGSD
jgi:hypothetical protein